MMRVYLTVFCAAIVCMVVLMALWSRRFQDNWVQHGGLWMVFFGALASGVRASTAYEVSEREAFTMAGMALFALGTAWKFWRHGGPFAR